MRNELSGIKMNNRFLHGGRIGDAIYALYTVKALGGGDFYFNQHHAPIGWNEELAKLTLKLIKYQDYVKKVGLINRQNITYNLIDAEQDYNPEKFPEWAGDDWPGNIHLAKRYAVHFGVDWGLDEPWLTAPKTKNIDVVVHAPSYRITDKIQLYFTILELLRNKYSVAIIGTPHDLEHWQYHQLADVQLVTPKDMLEAADWINSAKVFLGAVSSGHAIAEGLGKPRYVQAAQGCNNIHPTQFINGIDSEVIFEAIEKEFYA